MSAGTPTDRIADLFAAAADEESAEALRQDLGAVAPAELAGQFRQAWEVPEGFVVAAEASEVGTYTVLSDVRRRAHEARRLSEGAAGLCP